MTDVAELDEAPRGPAGPPRSAPVERARRVWRQLTSMRVALILLFLLAIAAIPGSLFPQRGADVARVRTYFLRHQAVAPLLDKLGMFDVYASPWFAAVYLLLFISLVGCVIPRLGQHLATVRLPPPPAPRNLFRLQESASYDTASAPEIERARIAEVMRGRRWRTVVRGDAVCAEKGFVREWGNLLFHYALVLLLIGIGTGGLFGYHGSLVLPAGQTFANTPVQYNAFDHGRAVDIRSLPPFTVRLDAFRASYLTNGQPSDFSAAVTWRPSPDAPPRQSLIGPDHPLGVPSSFLDGPTNVYLIGHGYSLHVVVRDPSGTVVYDDTQPARPLPGDNNLTSVGAVKVRDASPEQLGFAAVFAPTYSPSGSSSFPAPNDPKVTLTAYHGAIDDPRTASTIYELDTARMTPYRDGVLPLSKTLGIGESWQLPNGYSATFAGVSDWVQLSINHDPGKRTALVAAVMMVLGLLLSLFVSRRRIWARVSPGGAGVSVVEVGGLSRREGDSFDDEFARLVGQLSGADAEEARS